MESSPACESGKEKRGMNMITSVSVRCFIQPEARCNSSSIAPPGEDRVAARTRPNRGRSSSHVVRLAMRVSRSRWFSFLRRVFQYQNSTASSDPESNPFNSGLWMLLELVALVVQISVISVTLSVSKAEKPFWPMRIWISGYEIGCFLGLMMLYGRYKQHLRQQTDASNLPDTEQQRAADSWISQLTNKCKMSLDLFFAIWFVMGNVWVFDSRLGSFHHAPKLHVLSLTLLAWNAICYSFPFLLFILLCCIVPLVSSLLGYNMNLGSAERGASEDQISSLASWRYEEASNDLESGKKTNEETECCICLDRYKEKEEVRQLPCSHVFHLNCVGQWLRIISCCPICKRELQ